LIDRAGNSHEWDSDSASDCDDDINDDDENSDVTEEEVFDLSDSCFSISVRYYSSIKADSNASGSVQKEQPSDVTMRIAHGNTIKPRGVGTTMIVDQATGFPLPIKKMHGAFGRGA
jgi:hypothetical protein